MDRHTLCIWWWTHMSMQVRCDRCPDLCTMIAEKNSRARHGHQGLLTSARKLHPIIRLRDRSEYSNTYIWWEIQEVWQAIEQRARLKLCSQEHIMKLSSRRNMKCVFIIINISNCVSLNDTLKLESISHERILNGFQATRYIVTKVLNNVTSYVYPLIYYDKLSITRVITHFPPFWV